MNINTYYDKYDLYYSLLYGGGIYEENKHSIKIQEPLDYDLEGFSQIISNVNTKEKFWLKNIEEKVIERYKTNILNPPPRDIIYWPCDIVKLNNVQKKASSLFVGQKYTEDKLAIDMRTINYALVFPNKDFSDVFKLELNNTTEKNMGWKDPKVREVAIKIVKAIYSLNKSGYIFMDFHFSRFFMNKKSGQIYLNFSNLIFSKDDLKTDEIAVLKKYDYPIEFAEPALVNGIIKKVDYNSQNYSLCAMLFYMFFNRYAYDGRLMIAWPDDSEKNHYMKFERYHELPIFIFDDEDKENSLNGLEEEEIINLWEECPEEFKAIFTRTLKTENALRKLLIPNNPTPAEWLKCFKELKWM